jgi:hypothetical protein
VYRCLTASGYAFVASHRYPTKKGGTTTTRIDDKYLKLLRESYRMASGKEHGAILDEFEKAMGCYRKCEIGVLRGRGRRTNGATSRMRPKVYGGEEAQALLQLTNLFDGICPKRLPTAMDAELPACTSLDWCVSALAHTGS